MRRLKRTTIGTKNRAIDDRVDSLERRIYPYGLKYAYAGRNNTNQTIDTSAENIVFTSFSTNDADLFELDPANDGILVNVEGLYQTTGFTDSPDLATARQTYVQAEFLSVYPVFGNEFGRNLYALDTSLLDSTNARQNHHAFGTMGGTAANPYKVVLVAVRLGGVNYTVNNSALMVIKMANLPGF